MEIPASEGKSELFTIQETANLLGRSTKTIRNWRKRGWIQGFKYGGIWVVRREEIDRFLNRPEKTQADASPLQDQYEEIP